MKKAFLCLSAVVLSLNFVWVNPLSGLASKIETTKLKSTMDTNQQVNLKNNATDIVTSEDLGGQTWLINEVNRQLAPKKVGVDLTFDDLAKIKIISLSNKSLTGEVPPEIKNLVSLEKLLLYSNKLSGEIPAELGELTNLSELRLDYNQFTGKIPDGLGNISEIALQSNRLVGQIPLSLYENRTGENEVNVSGNQVTINSKQSEPSVYSAYTFVYPSSTPEYSGHIKANNSFISNLTNDMNLTPFLKNSPTFINLQAVYMFNSELFDGHDVTITDTNDGKVLYDGALTSDISIPLTNFKSGIHVINVMLDNAPNNPQNQTTFLIDILPVAAHDLTVNYVDKAGAEIHEPQTVSGNVGDDYDVTTPEFELSIDKYELDTEQMPTNGIGTLSSEAQTVTYVYKKMEGAPVTVKYVDENGNEITTSDTLTGKLDDSYQAKAKEIAGFTLDNSKLPANASGVFETNPQTVTYVYQAVLATIKAHDSTIYVGDKWSAEDNFDSAVNSVGAAVSFDDLEVEGTVDTTKAGVYPVTYSFAGESVTINVTVKAKDLPAPPVTPTKPVAPIQPTHPDQPNIQAAPGEHQASTDKPEALKVTAAQKEQPTVAGNLKLPTTGDNLWDSVLYSVFGLIAVCVAFSLFFRRKKQKHS
ncbi:cell surface protein [Listeria monocytogenes]|uniref:Putative peptidoglycan bound protein (LPXTG motif) n=1 Tax=Listeria monocytogenes serotype 4a (strain M7) TaxID=1030009 RepID=A0A0E0UTX9_LISMM|nr:MucBP domain-containing protein [Listeria monocytogenes]ACK40231.1 cell wall surface anchor family protein [Listeria monocytogenes HCC23]AEH91774.1 putative peptidoglycan bound protein (LPXTG motif) [Listeria monocytogenes M7]AKS53350.1 cell surface protein [Listeria monocytogenes]EAC6860771.1 cell surface protein [Listeria monocytogenes]EAD0181155.1 cell surface protein [Listeria monocytogenes]